jgi:hypothetical protein
MPGSGAAPETVGFRSAVQTSGGVSPAAMRGPWPEELMSAYAEIIREELSAWARLGAAVLLWPIALLLGLLARLMRRIERRAALGRGAQRSSR